MQDKNNKRQICKLIVPVVVLLFSIPCQARESEFIEHPGSEKTATKKVHTNFVKYEFPGKGSKKDWEEAAKLNYEASDLLSQKRYDECISVGEKVVALYPYDAEFFNCLAVDYFARRKEGDLELAEAALRKAVKLKPTSCTIWDNLAKGLYELKKYQEAIDAMKNALRYSPSAEKTSELEDNIKTIESVMK